MFAHAKRLNYIGSMDEHHGTHDMLFNLPIVTNDIAKVIHL